MDEIFTYTDYRTYMLDFYNHCKCHDDSFSYRVFSKDADIKSRSFMLNVINGNRNLATKIIPKLCIAMKFNESESVYFEKLVHFNQAKNLIETDFYFKQLNDANYKTWGSKEVKKIRTDKFEYYNEWYHVAVRSLVGLYDFTDDYLWLATKISPKITPVKAKKSIELLNRLGLIYKNKKGLYKIKNNFIGTGNDVQSHSIQHFHINNMELAKQASLNIDRDKRNISGLTVGISEKAYEKICASIYKHQEKILKIAEEDKGSDRVYHLSYNLFPMTKV